MIKEGNGVMSLYNRLIEAHKQATNKEVIKKEEKKELKPPLNGCGCGKKKKKRREM